MGTGNDAYSSPTRIFGFMTTPLSDHRARFSTLYRSISDGIAAASQSLSNLDFHHEDGRKAVDHIVGKLDEMQKKFSSELEELEHHVEWDTFTIAFFGETNSGKSTIIESLRILFDEESRARLLRENGRDLAKYEQALEFHVERVRAALLSAHERNLNEFQNVHQAVDRLHDACVARATSRQHRMTWAAAAAGLVLGALPSIAYFLHR